jgi:hypothetical protein
MGARVLINGTRYKEPISLYLQIVKVLGGCAEGLLVIAHGPGRISGSVKRGW